MARASAGLKQPRRRIFDPLARNLGQRITKRISHVSLGDRAPRKIGIPCFDDECVPNVLMYPVIGLRGFRLQSQLKSLGRSADLFDAAGIPFLKERICLFGVAFGKEVMESCKGTNWMAEPPNPQSVSN